MHKISRLSRGSSQTTRITFSDEKNNMLMILDASLSFADCSVFFFCDCKGSSRFIKIHPIKNVVKD